MPPPTHTRSAGTCLLRTPRSRGCPHGITPRLGGRIYRLAPAAPVMLRRSLRATPSSCLPTKSKAKALWEGEAGPRLPPAAYLRYLGSQPLPTSARRRLPGRPGRGPAGRRARPHTHIPPR